MTPDPRPASADTGPLQRPASEADADALSALVRESFTGLASEGWTSSAVAFLLAEASPESLALKLRQPTFAAGTFVGPQAVGFLLMLTPSVLGMMFVHPLWFRRGIGRALWEQARAHVEAAHPEVKTVELNATRFAFPFYRRLGFVPVSAEFRRAGCRAIRMACWLPARALGAELPPAGGPLWQP